MPTATAADALYQGADGNTSQTNDTDGMGGAPHATTQLVDASANLLFDSTPANAFGGADIVHHNILYRRCVAGTMSLGKAYLFNGLILSSGTGVLTFTLTNIADVGLQVRIIALVGGVFPGTPEQTVMANPSVNSVVAPDTAKTYRLECLDASTGLTPTAPAGDIIVSQAGQILGAIRAARTDHAGNSLVLTQATAEYELAAASSKNTDLSSANRLAAPSGIGAFSRPILLDAPYAYESSLTVPDLDSAGNGGAGDYHGLCVRKTLINGIPVALGGAVRVGFGYRFAAGS